MLDGMFHSVLAELKFGYVTTYAFDCAVEHPEVSEEANVQAMCGRSGDDKTFTPIFILYKPPELAVNPYTGSKMPVSVVPYASNAVSDGDVKKWITENIPDYTQRLQTSDDAAQFASETGIQMVYLFSSKQKVPPIYRALAAHYRNRVRFAFVPAEAQAAAELAEKFEVEKWPTLLAHNPEGHFLYGGKMKLDALIEFVEGYALPEDQKKEERVIASKGQTSVNKMSDTISSYKTLTSVSEI